MIYCGRLIVAAVPSVDVGEAQVKENARILVRAPSMRLTLEHIQTELEGDDEGSRHRDLIELIRAELATSAPPAPKQTKSP